MIQIFAFLIERFASIQACLVGMDLGEMLEQAGFDNDEISKTLLFLQLLDEQATMLQQPIEPQSTSMRVYHPDEYDHLPINVLGFIHFMHSVGALDWVQHEFILYVLMHLSEDEITLDTVKSLVLLMVWAQSVPVPVLIGDEFTAILCRKNVM